MNERLTARLKIADNNKAGKKTIYSVKSTFAMNACLTALLEMDLNLKLENQNPEP